MGGTSEPQQLSQTLSKLIALKGLARRGGQGQLQAIWEETVGGRFAAQTRVLALKGGVLHIGVRNSAMLSELVSFHKSSLLDVLTRQHAHLNIGDLKFRLRGDLLVEEHDRF